MSWLIANWKDLVLALLAVDTALIPLFPKAGILGTIKTWLTDASQA